MSVEDIRSLTIKGWDDRERLDWRIVAHKLARARPIVSAYARAKYALDEDSKVNLVCMMYNEWTDEDDDVTFRMCVLAVNEAIDHGKCRTCKGRGKFVTDDKQIECQACKGTGEVRWSEKYRRKYVGVGVAEWNKLREKFWRMKEYLIDMELELHRVMKKW